MSNTHKPEQIRAAVLHATLTLLENGTPWPTLTIKDVAKHADISYAHTQEIYTSKSDIYQGLLKDIDRKIEAQADPYLYSETPRDRLFELLMLHFDILNEYPTAYRNLFLETFKNPSLFRYALSGFHRSMEVVLRLCDLNGRNDTSCPPLRTGAVALVFLNTLRVWTTDNTTDMAQTMAELDRGLNRLEQAMGYIPAPLKRFI